MKKYLVLYMAPASMMAEWMKKPESERKEAEDKMRSDWDAWMKAHGSALKETAGAGKTKVVDKQGVKDMKNDVMLFSMVEAESDEEAANLFKDHPHFGIPEATIQVMPVNSLPRM